MRGDSELVMLAKELEEEVEELRLTIQDATCAECADTVGRNWLHVNGGIYCSMECAGV